MGNKAATRLNMASDATITGVLAREILDSRGNPTVEVRSFDLNL
jgi:hypothetical protein